MADTSFKDLAVIQKDQSPFKILTWKIAENQKTLEIHPSLFPVRNTLIGNQPIDKREEIADANLDFESISTVDFPDQCRLVWRITRIKQGNFIRWTKSGQADRVHINAHAFPRKVHLVNPLLKREYTFLLNQGCPRIIKTDNGLASFGQRHQFDSSVHRVP